MPASKIGRFFLINSLVSLLSLLNPKLGFSEAPKAENEGLAVGAENEELVAHGHGGHGGHGHHHHHHHHHHHWHHHHHHAWWHHHHHPHWNHHHWHHWHHWHNPYHNWYWYGGGDWGGNPGYYYDPNYYYNVEGYPSVEYEFDQSAPNTNVNVQQNIQQPPLDNEEYNDESEYQNVESELDGPQVLQNQNAQ